MGISITTYNILSHIQNKRRDAQRHELEMKKLDVISNRITDIEYRQMERQLSRDLKQVRKSQESGS